MKRTMNLAVIITMVLGMATVALAVAGTVRSPQPNDVPVMVTERPTDSVTATPTPAGPDGQAVANTGNLSGTSDPAPPANKNSASVTHSKPSPSSKPVVSGKKKSVVKKPAAPPKTSATKPPASSTDGDHDIFEVVKPHVSDRDDEGDSGHSKKSGVSHPKEGSSGKGD